MELGTASEHQDASKFHVTPSVGGRRIENIMQRSLTCHICGSPLLLVRQDVPNYSWRCPTNCIPIIDTGVSSGETLDELLPDESGTVEFNASHFFPPLTRSRVATAKVFMAQILYHFIECSWSACYNSLYFNVLVPCLDSPEIVDYVLRGSVVHERIGIETGKTGAKIYPELRARLHGVESSRIHDYLTENFRRSN